MRCWAQYLGDLGCEHVVFKNDQKTVEEIASMNPRGILVSPGPGDMSDPAVPQLLYTVLSLCCEVGHDCSHWQVCRQSTCVFEEGPCMGVHPS